MASSPARSRFPYQGGEIPAYRAMPATGGPFATILVVHEIFGVHEHIKDICRRLAKVGIFRRRAVSLFARGRRRRQDRHEGWYLPIVRRVPEAQVASDLDATVAWAKSTGNADTSRLGITGFCWGGRQVWLYAAHNPNLKAARRMVRAAAISEIGTIAGQSCRCGQGDECAGARALWRRGRIASPPRKSMRCARRLRPPDKSSEIIVYPDTPHAFNADYRPSYRPKRGQRWMGADAGVVQEIRRPGRR